MDAQLIELAGELDLHLHCPRSTVPLVLGSGLGLMHQNPSSFPCVQETVHDLRQLTGKQPQIMITGVASEIN